MRSLDQARHIAHRKPMEIGIFYNADLGMKGGEGIGGDFGAGARDGGQQSRFPGVGIPYQARLGHDAQLKKEIALASRLARLRETRSLARRGGKVAVSQAAASGFAQDEALTMVG